MAASSDEQIEQGSKGRRVRAWLRRVMPRVGIAAAALFVVRAIVRDTGFYRTSAVGEMFGFITFLLVTLTVCYYGFGALRWLKRKLLWRVRRRLIITYLFVGLTPIVLLAGLGFIFGYGMALNMMANSVMLEVGSTEKVVRANAVALADALAQLPPASDARTLQAGLDERATLMQASLPGARAALWRGPLHSAPGGTGGSDTAVQAQFISAPPNADAQPLGPQATTLDAPLPAWLRGQQAWSGFTYERPANASEPYAASALRALVRREANGQEYVVLLSVPVNRVLIERWRADTDINLRPSFFPHSLAGNVRTRRADNAATPAQAAQTDAAERAVMLRTSADQLGEPMSGPHAWVVMPVTDWVSGEREPHVAFKFPSSITAARQHVLERGHLGQDLPLTWVLTVFGIIFLTLELFALFAAGWMTRAVTGTVHKLYRATEHIKRGDFSHRVRVRSQDQLGELAGAYNDMTANIEALLQERVKHERLEREIEIAAEVQAQLFPREVPRLQTVELAGECRAARGVAGDYYDYVEIAPGLVAVALGDVSGKGISASLVMSNLQASLRAQATILAERLRQAERAAAVAVGAGVNVEPPCGVTGVDNACAVAEIVANINAQLCRSTDSNRFATLFIALYDERTRTLRYTNAGHNAPFLIHADGTHERLEAGGTVAGAFDFARYEESAATLAPGDLLLIFSDGLSEAQNHTGEEYGEARLFQFARQHRAQTADALRHAIFTEIDQWSGGLERGDDQTVVIVKASA